MKLTLEWDDEKRIVEKSMDSPDITEYYNMCVVLARTMYPQDAIKKLFKI